MFRCFVALELPVPLQNAIEGALTDLRAGIGADVVRWVPCHNIHLTLKFLGETAVSSLEMIRASLESVTARFSPFDVLVTGFGTFPNVREPRILWVGLTAPHILASLHRELDLATVRLGYASEGRAFSPHLTVGRTRQHVGQMEAKRLRMGLERMELGEIGGWNVDAVHLFQSELLPSGSVYTKLFSAALAAG